MIDAIKNALGLRTIPETSSYLGIVRYAFPWLNLYVVEPFLNGSIAKDYRLVAGSDSSSRRGSISHAYSVGDTVLCACDSDNEYSHSTTDYIVGHAAATNTADLAGPSISISSDKEIPGILKSIFDKFRSFCDGLLMQSQKRYLQPTDMLSGDTHIGGSPNTGVSVLKHLVRIQCGKSCYVELDSIMSRIRIVTEKMEYVGPLRNYQDLSGRGSLLEYNQTALTYEEGTLGVFDDNDTRSPVFRKKEVAGDVTSGWQTAISLPDINTGKSDDVYSSKVRYDGAVTMASAKGFEIKKTLNIVSPYQKVEPQGFGTVLKEVEEFPEFSNNYTNTDDDYHDNKSLNIQEDAVNSLDEEYPRVDANPDTWGKTSDTHTNRVKSALNTPTKLSLLGTAQQYPLPDTITLTDPHTGQTYTYFKSESGIRQDPDGSLVFYDGYGSEIRMTRGNIIISPAADIVMRPGRDFHTMAGRHIAMVAQQDNIVHSSTKDVYIKGNHDVSILSGVDKMGKTIIDDRGAGVLVRSLSKASMASPDVFIGNIPTKMPSSFSGVSQGKGKVVVGGGATTLITGTAITMAGESSDIIAYKKGSNGVSWVSVDSQRTVTLSKDNYISGGTHVGHISGTLTAAVGDTILSAGNQSETSTIYITSTVESMHTIKCPQLWATQIMGVRVYAANADADSGIKARVVDPKLPKDIPTITQTSSIEAYFGGAWQDSFTLGSQFMYPTSSDFMTAGSDYKLPGILWQKYLTNGKLWKETPIPNIIDKSKTSMVYPGEEAWGGVITVSVSDSAPILGGYKING